MEWRQTERPLLRALVRELAQQPGWELVLLRTRDPGLAAGRLAAAARQDARAHRAHRRRARRTAPGRIDLRPRRRRVAAPRRRGPDGRRRDRSAARTRRAARARRRRDGADDRGRSLPRPPRRGEPRGGAVADGRGARRPRSRRSTSASPPAGAAPRRARRSRSATGSSPTSTCTRAGRTTARSTSTSCSTTPRRRGSARSRSPTTTSSAAPSEAVERARGRRLVVIPGEEVKTADQGEVIGLFLREEIPRGMSFGDTVAAIRAQGGLVYLPHPFDRLHAIPEPATLASAPRRDRRTRGLQRAAPLRGLQRRGAPLRAQVQPHPRRGLRRARPRRRRHGRRPDAPLQRPGGVPRLAPRRRGAAAARSRSSTCRD